MSHVFHFRETVGRHFVECSGPWKSRNQTLTILNESLNPAEAYLAALSICHKYKVRFMGFLKSNPAQFRIRCTRKTSTDIWEGGREML